MVVTSGQCMSDKHDSGEPEKTPSPGTFFLAPPPDWQVKLIESIVIKEKFDSLTIIYDDTLRKYTLIRDICFFFTFTFILFVSY